MGVVFEAEDESLNRKVALKVISPHLAEDDDFRARFTREAQAQASLDSAHVVHVYAHGVDDGCLYIAAQLIPDGDLGQMLAAYGAPPIAGRARRDGAGGRGSRRRARGRADPPRHQARERAAAPARERHPGLPQRLRDRPPGRRRAHPHRHSTIGTPSYMAPELHTGGRAGVETDVYSLGCLLWATLTGRAPYAGTSEFQIVTAHLEQPVPQLPADGPLATEVNRILRTRDGQGPGRAVPLRRGPARRPAPGPDPPRHRDADRTGAVAASQARARRSIGVLVAGHRRYCSRLLVAGVAYAVDQRRRRRGPGPPSIRPHSSATIPVRPELAAEPSEPTTGGPRLTPSGSDEEAAVASLDRRSSRPAGGLSPAGRRVQWPSSWVESAGLQEMIDAGLFDADMNYVDVDQADLPPEIATAEHGRDGVPPCASP